MKKNLPIYLLILAICLAALPAFFCGQSAALAEGASSAAQSGLDAAATSAGLSSNKDAVQLAGQIVQTVLSFLGIIFIILLLYGGFIRMTAQGSPEKIKHSTGIITSAIVGIIIIFTSYIVTIFVIKQLQNTVNDNNPVGGIRGGEVREGDLPSDIPVECVAGGGACSWLSCSSDQTASCVNGQCVCQ
jgi:hypothetical protein